MSKICKKRVHGNGETILPWALVSQVALFSTTCQRFSSVFLKSSKTFSINCKGSYSLLRLLFTFLAVSHLSSIYVAFVHPETAFKNIGRANILFRITFTYHQMSYIYTIAMFSEYVLFLASNFTCKNIARNWIV